jgi:hypothetical protein
MSFRHSPRPANIAALCLIALLIGIGTNRPVTVLDAPFGEIKPGSSGAACTAQIAGAIRYADAKLQVCDGKNWRMLALEPAR